jgi:hypothetical protein
MLRANDDTGRFARGSLGSRRAARCRCSSASLRNSPIDYLKIDGSFTCQLKDHSIDRATVESKRTVFNRFDKTATARL